MHKCKIRGCKNQIDDKYTVCFRHRDTKYIDSCPIHGRTHFVNNHCIKCQQLKEPEYIITKRGNKYFFKDGKQVTEKSILFPLLERLTHLTRKYQEKYISKVTEGPGIYGIFVKKGNELGECLYIGQSVNVKQRVHQHRECFKIAKYHINALKRHHKVRLSTINRKVEYKYYAMAIKYNLSDLKFVKIISLEDGPYLSDALTYCEQAMMTAFKPKFNTFAARPTAKHRREG